MDLFNIVFWNHILLPPFLFIVFFSSICLVVQHSSTITETSLIYTSNLNTVSSNSEKIIPTENSKSKTKSDNIPKQTKDVKTQQQTEIVTSNNFYFQVDNILKQLNKRQSRKICSPLNIRQRQNGVDKSLAKIKAEILTVFKTKPDKVIEAIYQRLPDLLPTSID